MPLVHVSPNQIAGLIEALAAAPYDGKADLPDIAYEQELEVDELFPVAEAMQLLRLAEIEGGDIRLTHMGKRFADGELNERKEIFSRSLMNNVPLAAHIRRILDERASHSAPKTPLPGRAGRPYGRRCRGRYAEDGGVAGPASANCSRMTTTRPF